MNDLDPKGLANAKKAMNWGPFPHAEEQLLVKAIRAYLAASPSPSEMEVVAWQVKDFADGWMLSNIEAAAKAYQNDGHLVEHLVTLSSAQSALSAMAAERDEAKENAKALRGLLEYSEDSIARLQTKWQFQLERADAAESQVKRLTEENAEAERVRELMARDWFEFCESMGATPDTQEAVAYELSSRASSDKARIKALEEALRAVSDTSHRARDRKHYRFPLAIMKKVDAALSQGGGE